jgi:DNA-binding transcriptional MerR regulator
MSKKRASTEEIIYGLAGDVQTLRDAVEGTASAVMAHDVLLHAVKNILADRMGLTQEDLQAEILRAQKEIETARAEFTARRDEWILQLRQMKKNGVPDAELEEIARECSDTQRAPNEIRMERIASGRALTHIETATEDQVAFVFGG